MTIEDEQQGSLLDRLTGRFGIGGRAGYGFIGCALTISLCGLAAYLAKEPMLFPSLGPSALLFFEKPTAPESSPYNRLDRVGRHGPTNRQPCLSQHATAN